MIIHLCGLGKRAEGRSGLGHERCFVGAQFHWAIAAVEHNRCNRPVKLGSYMMATCKANNTFKLTLCFYGVDLERHRWRPHE